VLLFDGPVVRIDLALHGVEDQSHVEVGSSRPVPDVDVDADIPDQEFP